jgi:XTP/dITP diphosphohydrolase
MLPSRIAIATRNEHKLLELGRICAGWPVTWLTIHDHPGPWPDVEETGDTYLENALLKARAVATALGEPAMADDSGIEVDALGGKPGPRSARFAGEDASDPENLRALIQAMAGVPSSGRSARYRCVAAMAWPDGREVHAEGVCEGTLVRKPQGVGGFGYDPAFVPEGRDETMAELSAEEKDRISHRGRAFRALKETLEAPESAV